MRQRVIYDKRNLRKIVLVGLPALKKEKMSANKASADSARAGGDLSAVSGNNNTITKNTYNGVPIGYAAFALISFFAILSYGAKKYSEINRKLSLFFRKKTLWNELKKYLI